MNNKDLKLEQKPNSEQMPIDTTSAIACTKPNVVCSACQSDCGNGFSPEGSENWFCDSDCYDDFFDDFQSCGRCDFPDACADFGCAVKAGIKQVSY